MASAPGGFNQMPPGNVGHPPQGGFGPPPPQGGFGPPQYEFSHLENETIGAVAKWAKFLAIALFVNGGLSLMGCNVVYILGYVAIGVPIFMAGNAFQRVVDTRGRDVTNMMEAVQALGTSFLVRIIVMVAMIALTFLILGLMVAFFGVIVAMVARGGTR